MKKTILTIDRIKVRVSGLAHAADAANMAGIRAALAKLPSALASGWHSEPVSAAAGDITASIVNAVARRAGAIRQEEQ